MSESEISPLKQLSVLSKSLFKLLDEEFELLSGRDFLSVEKIQVKKVEKMQELDILWKSVGSGDLSGDQLVLFDEIRNNCIPPIFIIGIRVIAITIIPIPPNH